MMMLALMLLAACNGGCENYCSDLAVVYSDIAAGSRADAADIMSDEEYLANCEDAPKTGSCEECTAWYQQTVLEPIGVSGSCDDAYGRSPYQVDDDDLAEREEECDDTCGVYGLNF